MKLVTNTNQRQRWEDPLTGTIIPPKTQVPVEDDIANGVYFQRAANRRKPKLIIKNAPAKTTTKKRKTVVAMKEG